MKMKCFIVYFCFCIFGILQVHGQIMGYPLPGSADYPEMDGRRIDRIVLETDRSFKVVVADESNQVAFCVSDNLNIPYIVRFDLNTFSKIDRLVLDNGITAITSGAIDPFSGNIWFGSNGYCLIMDPVKFEIVRIIPVGNCQVTKILFHSIEQKVLLLSKSDPDGVIEMETKDFSFDFYPFPGFKNVFTDAVISLQEMALVVLASSSPPSVILADLNDYQTISVTEVQSDYPITTFALNSVKNELYVAATGSPSFINRYDFPDMSLNGSIALPSGERPRGFMFCDDQGAHVYVNDGDSSGGLIKIKTESFQRVDRLDFADLKHPICYDRFDDTILIATENMPGGILQVSLDMFTILRQHEFLDCETSAGIVCSAPVLDTVYLGVKNSGIFRLAGFNSQTGQRNCHIDLPAVTGSVILSACDEQNSIGYFVESDDTSWIISIDLQKGEMLDRKQLPITEGYRDFIYSEASNSLFLLSTSSIFEFDATSLAPIDSIDLESYIIPAKTFALDRRHSCLLVGGGGNSGKMIQYTLSPLAFDEVIDLDQGERKVVLMRADASSSEIFIIVDATPYKIKRFDTVSREFTATVTLPFSGTNLVGLHSIPCLNQVLVFEETGTTRIHRLDTCDDDWISPVTLQSGERYLDACMVESAPYAFISLAGICPSIVRYGATQAHAIHGSWASLDEASYLESLNFYSHEAGNHVKVAVYNQTGLLLWESEFVQNSIENDWLKVFISDGFPSELRLDPDEYLLAFQVTGDGYSPSATASSIGSSIRSPWPCGMFPNTLVKWDETDVLWSIYGNCSSSPPSPTFTPPPTPTFTSPPSPTFTPSPSPTFTPPQETPTSPSPSPSSVPSATPTVSFTHTPTPKPQPTATPTLFPSHTPKPTVNPTDTPGYTPTPEMTHSPTPTALPTDSPLPTMAPTITPSPTTTPQPGSGVDLSLTQNEFYPGDHFRLQARLANMEPSPTNIELYIILDVYGNYWFGPRWSDNCDAYTINGFIGIRTMTIFDFTWPEVDSEAQGIIFWAGMVAEGESTLFGFYDRIEFAYAAKQETPTPEPTNTSTQSQTPTPEPTQTAAPPDEIRYVFATKDPMTYPGENCQEPDIYCFAPERMNFCSDWRPVVFLENIGAQPVNIDVKIEGSDPYDFQIEDHNLYINSGDTKPVKIRFCPLSPPDLLKTANIIMEWSGGTLMIEVKGWCVAGKQER